MELWLLLWMAVAIAVVTLDVVVVSVRNAVRAANRVSAHADRIGTPPIVEPHRVERLSARFAALAEHAALIDVRCRKASIGVAAALAAWRAMRAGLRGR